MGRRLAAARWLVVGVVTCGVLGCSRGRKDDAGVAATEAARKREEERVARRRACGLAESAPPLHETSSIQGECQKAVLQELTSPNTAAFPGMFDEDNPLVSPDGCVTTYASWVNAESSFGAPIHQNYECTYDPRTGVARVVFP